MGDHNILLIGSVPLQNSEAVFRALATHLGNDAVAFPDGETGGRLAFVGWFGQRLGTLPDLEVAKEISFDGPVEQTIKFYRMKLGKHVSDLPLTPLGYAEVAKASYEEFRRLRANGEMPADARFQVCLPSALNLSWFLKEPFEERIAAFEQALRTEIAELTAAIPTADLTIQWDAPLETHGEEFARRSVAPPDFLARDWTFEQSTDSLARLCDAVPPDVSMGVHLCYGDPDGHHLIEPHDMSVMVDIANSVAEKTARPINYIHMPVPIERNDDAYFAPLDTLRVGPATRLFLGLVHAEDGIDGARVRLAAARRHVRDFGIGGECGLGRRPPAIVPALLDLHREVAAL